MKTPWIILVAIILKLVIFGNSFSLHDVTFYPLDSRIRERRLDTKQKLWIIKTPTQPVLPVQAYLGNGTFIVKSIYLAEEPNGEYAPFNPEYKFRPDINTTNGIIIKCISTKVTLPTIVDVIPISKTVAIVTNPVSIDVVLAIAKSSNILWIDGRSIIEPSSMQSRRVLMGNTPLATQGKGRLMITDSGLDVFHCAFNSRTFATGSLLLNNPIPVFSSSAVVTVEYSPGLVTSLTRRDGAHGTMVAGVAQGACNMGVYTPPGQSTLLFVELGMVDQPGHLVRPQSMDPIFEMGFRNNISIHVASWTSNLQYYDTTAFEFDDSARNYDLLHVVAAGNHGQRVRAPANAKNVISVGATLLDEYPWYSGPFETCKIVDFSAIGPTLDGRIAPTLHAPGYWIQVPYAFSENVNNHMDYVYQSGTSFSAPAIAALALYIDEWHLNLTGLKATASLKKAILISRARPTCGYVSTPFPFLPITKPTSLSYGVPLLIDSPIQFINNQSLETRLSWTFTGNITSAVIAWMDLPAFPTLDDLLLVNDLDMFIYLNNQELYLNNHLDTTEKITLENVETIRIVIVAANTLSGGQQQFALAVLGALSMSISKTCLYRDGNSTHSCNPETGEMIPFIRSCPIIWNGTTCLNETVSSTCLIPNGEGFIFNNTCFPRRCNPNYWLSPFGCTCAFARQCDSSVFFAHCVNNSFTSCLAAIPPPTIVVTSTPANGLSPPEIVLITLGSIFGVLLLLTGIAVGKANAKKKSNTE